MDSWEMPVTPGMWKGKMQGSRSSPRVRLTVVHGSVILTKSRFKALPSGGSSRRGRRRDLCPPGCAIRTPDVSCFRSELLPLSPARAPEDPHGGDRRAGRRVRRWRRREAGALAGSSEQTQV